jgi:hypothetical protein
MLCALTFGTKIFILHYMKAGILNSQKVEMYEVLPDSERRIGRRLYC